MTRLSVLIAAAVASLALAACGADDADDDDTAPAAAAANIQDYCALTKRLDAAGEKFFATLGENASPEEFQTAERRFVERHTRDLDELRRVAPVRLKPDVDRLLTAMRQRAGLDPGVEVSEREASAAEERIQAFERRECA